MEPESFYNLLQRPKVAGPPAEEELPQGAVSRGGRGAGRAGQQGWVLVRVCTAGTRQAGLGTALLYQVVLRTPSSIRPLPMPSASSLTAPRP